MIELESWIWFAICLLAGFVHATMLWHNVERLTLWSPLFGFLRLGIVASLLFLAAVSGEIFSGAVGWAVGFASLAIWLSVRRKGDSPGSSNAPPASHGTTP